VFDMTTDGRTGGGATARFSIIMFSGLETSFFKPISLQSLSLISLNTLRTSSGCSMLFVSVPES